MDVNNLDHEKYSDITLYKMKDNNHGGELPFFVREYAIKNHDAPIIHRHEYMQINYVFRGKAQHMINNNVFDIYKGDIFIIPPYIPHRIIASEGSEAEILELEFEPGFVIQGFDNFESVESFFDFAYLEPFLVSENSVKPRLNLSGEILLDVEAILNEILREYREKPSGFKLLIKAALLKLLVVVGREFTRNLEKGEGASTYCLHKEAIFAAVKYIGEHFSEPLNTEDVARRLSLSQSYFSYLFKAIMRRTFTEYLNELRLKKAMEILKSTDKRVMDICLDVGFNNVNHFNRIFKKHTGISPLSYRKKNSTQ